MVDDGTGEAHVWFSGDLLRPLLGLDDSQWEGLQKALRVKGHIRVYPRGRSLVSTTWSGLWTEVLPVFTCLSAPQVTDGDSEDVLLHFLLSVCSSEVVSRPVSLTCRRLSSTRTEGNTEPEPEPDLDLDQSS